LRTSLNKKSVLVAIFIVSAFLLLLIILIGLLNYTNKVNDSTTISYPTSYIPSFPVSLESDAIIPEYSVEITQNSFLYYSLIYTNQEGTKEIYRWIQVSGFGSGGKNCTGVSYSPDRKFFAACASSAEMVEHQYIPLIFNYKGELVTDFAKISNFNTRTLKHSKYTYNDISLEGREFLIGESVSFSWLDNSNLILKIKDVDYIYELGTDKLVLR